MTELLADLKEDEPDSILWRNMVYFNGVNSSFNAFLEYNIKLCINNLRSDKNEIIDYSLELFKTIFTALKKQDH